MYTFLLLGKETKLPKFSHLDLFISRIHPSKKRTWTGDTLTFFF